MLPQRVAGAHRTLLSINMCNGGHHILRETFFKPKGLQRQPVTVVENGKKKKATNRKEEP